MFSFKDFKDVVSELALHAKSKMINFMRGLFIFYQMITAPSTKWPFFVLIMNRPFAVKPSRDLRFIKLWAATLRMPEMEKAC